MGEATRKVRLVRKLDGVFASFDGSGEEKPVKLVWARPVSGKGEEVSIVGKDKTELMMLKNLDCLDATSRKIAEEELAARYLVPKITRVIRTHPSFGNRYWAVETNLGWRSFVMKDPTKNASWLSQDRVIIRDTLGNRYEIESVSKLDVRSRAEVQKVL